MKCQSSFNKNRGLCSLIAIGFWCLIFVASLLISHGSAYAAQVTLAWDASDGAAGYKIYYGTTSNNYTTVVDVGTALTYTFSNLPDGNTYYFAATAYDASHLESDYSAEISYDASLGNLLFANFSGYGVYSWNGSSWRRITDGSQHSFAASGSDLYADFGTSGIWKWNGSAWSRITDGTPVQDMVASGSVLYMDFGVSGIYKWTGSAWSHIASSDPASMVAGQ
jgi:hypothetical protein